VAGLSEFLRLRFSGGIGFVGHRESRHPLGEYDPTGIIAFVNANLRRFTAELQAFVHIPSVSSDPRRAGDVRRCATWLASQLRHAGLTRVRVLPTARHPIMYGEWLGAQGKPTILIYGHYDVQPAEPLTDWKFPMPR
jgi:acetylornithine deacetylase/succinyl-diaminopimelate desuccinylase-like protein